MHMQAMVSELLGIEFNRVDLTNRPGVIAQQSSLLGRVPCLCDG